MLQVLSEEIRRCYREAADCAQQAKTASTEQWRAEQRWKGTARGKPGPDQTDKSQNGPVAIVDDDEYARAGLRTLIESLGRRAVTFAAAEEYLASLVAESAERAACLILDVHLPGMSGPDLQAHLITQGRCPPTIFVTGCFEEHVRMRVIEAGALGYFMKLSREYDLLSCIGTILRSVA